MRVHCTRVCGCGCGGVGEGGGHTTNRESVYDNTQWGRALFHVEHGHTCRGVVPALAPELWGLLVLGMWVGGWLVVGRILCECGW